MPKINLNKLSGLLLILLIITIVAPIATVVASNGNGAEQSQQSENSNSSATPTANQNQNQTNTQNGTGNETGTSERQQIQARETTRLQYRNMTMTMNCTQNCEVVLNADEDVTPKQFQLSIDANHTMKLEMNLSKSPLNGAMVNERTLNFYLGIEPNATQQLQAQIRLYINQTELSQSMNREVNASRLTWMYWNQTTAQWQAVESNMDQNGYLVCNTDHFSTWTVAELETSAEPTPTIAEISSFPIEYIAIGAIAAIVVVAVAVVAYKKHK